MEMFWFVNVGNRFSVQVGSNTNHFLISILEGYNTELDCTSCGCHVPSPWTSGMESRSIGAPWATTFNEVDFISKSRLKNFKSLMHLQTP